MASAGLNKTFSGAGTNNKKGTISFWMKKTKLGAAQVGLTTEGASGGNAGLQFGSDDRLDMYLAYDGAWRGIFETTRVFRDTSAWYHIVVAWDTTQATDTNRLKFYVNGVQETSFVSITYPPQDQVTTFGNAQAHYINYWSNSNYFDGLMTHIHYTDGYTYAATDFGETDSTSGIWKPKTSPSVTYGTNGFFLKMENSSDMGEDSSGNNNDFTTSGTITQTEDTPSNNFATLNALDNYYQNATFTNGNLTIATGVSERCVTTATMGFASGKWYWEIKGGSNFGVGAYLGITSQQTTNNGASISKAVGVGQYEYAYQSSDGSKVNNNNATSYGNSFTDNDIIGVAVDLDNLKIYFSKNGVWQNSGDPTSGATGTGAAFTIENPANTTLGLYFPAFSDWWVNSLNASFNFGNGYFGTTAVASSNSDSAGLGLFEYSVPSGYYALCTKNIKNYG